MVNIEGLLGKVANNGATLLGILANGEWNTLVQAVRELQQIAASDTRLANMQAAINQLANRVEGFDTTYDDAIQGINGRINDDAEAYQTMQFAGIVEDATLDNGSVTTDTSWEGVYYIQNKHRFAYFKSGTYYKSWNGMYFWCANSEGKPIKSKIYLYYNNIYVYNELSNELKQANNSRYDSLVSSLASLETSLESIGEDLSSIMSEQEKALKYARFDGFISGTIQFEQTSLSNYIALNSKVLFYKDIHRFILKYGFKYYSSWSNVADYNDVANECPYVNKMYMYGNQLYMFNFDNGELDPISIGIVCLTAAQYDALGSDVNENLLYGIYEEE